MSWLLRHAPVLWVGLMVIGAFVADLITGNI